MVHLHHDENSNFYQISMAIQQLKWTLKWSKAGTQYGFYETMLSYQDNVNAYCENLQIKNNDLNQLTTVQKVSWY